MRSPVVVEKFHRLCKQVIAVGTIPEDNKLKQKLADLRWCIFHVLFSNQYEHICLSSFLDSSMVAKVVPSVAEYRE
ncbi:unnamed protein product [Ilex paraguariensis]|uniref:Uncharacterized protein n=1 Tax=Ilex paraguariensis TaxID=185542 RepID=A0ABC8UB49_9AQUA